MSRRMNAGNKHCVKSNMRYMALLSNRQKIQQEMNTNQGKSLKFHELLYLVWHAAHNITFLLT